MQFLQDAIEHCCKILRILKLPRGNALLVGVGGSGRHCQSRLACFVADFECFQIEIDRTYRHPSFRDDLKKIYDKTGVKGQSLCFLYSDTEIITESFLEDISNILSSGEVPNLFASDELSSILNACEKPCKEALGVRMVTPEQLYVFFIARVRECMHVVMCMSPTGTSFRNYCRMYPSLVSCTTIDWFLTWPPEALTEVALKFLLGTGDEENWDGNGLAYPHRTGFGPVSDQYVIRVMSPCHVTVSCRTSDLRRPNVIRVACQICGVMSDAQCHSRLCAVHVTV